MPIGSRLLRSDTDESIEVVFANETSRFVRDSFGLLLHWADCASLARRGEVWLPGLDGCLTEHHHGMLIMVCLHADMAGNLRIQLGHPSTEGREPQTRRTVARRRCFRLPLAAAAGCS